VYLAKCAHGYYNMVGGWLNQGEWGTETGVCIENLRYSHKILFEKPKDKGSPGKTGGWGVGVDENIQKGEKNDVRIWNGSSRLGQGLILVSCEYSGMRVSAYSYILTIVQSTYSAADTG